MSRTYRRKKHPTPDWVTEESEKMYIRGRIFYYTTPRWEYTSDKFNSTPWSQALKEETRRRRRHHDKTQTFAAMKIADIEEVDWISYEKLYLGFVWNWD